MDHRVHAGAVGQAGVHHRGRLVDAPAHLADDLVDDAAEVVFVDEGRTGGLDLARPLDEHQLGAVDHDLGDVVFLQVAVDRAVAEDVVGDILDELGLVGGRQRRLLLGQGLLELVLDPGPKVVLAEATVVEKGTELVDQVVVDLLAQVVEHRVAAARARRGAHLVKTLGQ